MRSYDDDDDDDDDDDVRNACLPLDSSSLFRTRRNANACASFGESLDGLTESSILHTARIGEKDEEEKEEREGRRRGEHQN